MAAVLQGRVSDGTGNAAHWLELYKDAYEHKTGMRIHPGSLNLAIDRDFPLRTLDLQERLIVMLGEEYGGLRDILMLPCILSSLGGQRALIWRTNNAEMVAEDRRILEILAEVNLRETFRLKNGDSVEVTVGLQAEREGIWGRTFSACDAGRPLPLAPSPLAERGEPESSGESTG